MAFINDVIMYEPPEDAAVDSAALTEPQEIQVMSDLHLEFKFRVKGGKNDDRAAGYVVFDFPVAAPNLALLGDIGLATHEGLYHFLETQLHRFKRVFYVPGNHEYYGASPTQAMGRMQAFADRMQFVHAREPNEVGEFILLHRRRYDLSAHVTILGCTLWSHVPPHAEDAVWYHLNDFRQIEHWTVGAHNASHDMDRLFLTRELDKLRGSGRRVFIMTHHAPTTPGTSEPRFETGDNLPSYGFVTPLSDSEWWAPPITTWAFGHTHFNCDFVRKGVRVVANQRGYDAFETHRIGFIENKVLLV
ncbi:hypothetical protein EXIGLDRAFT_731233 [Exidia glandulosa HHB12029]|uniref:Uncharacterized protein n=1 Tax=Exidia glandulosa HHB12029 TaxID=1314781 RepID=A0A166B258_EXIGL|nr:hypothetical protein EXIGLDRAFT_731233 [Exidia glandulosa HHB12029]